MTDALVPALLTIMLGGSPVGQIEGFVAPSACDKALTLPRMEDRLHRPVAAKVVCERTGR